MGIRIGYEPVGAIGELAYRAGTGKRDEREADIARQQAEADAQREFQQKLESLRLERERNSRYSQAQRDAMLHKYGQEDILLKNQLGLGKSLAVKQQEEEARRQLETQKYKQKMLKDYLDGKYVPRPEYTKEFAKLRKSRAEIERQIQSGDLSPAEGKMLLSQVDDKFNQMLDPVHLQKNPNAVPEMDEIKAKVAEYQRLLDETGYGSVSLVMPDGTHLKLESRRKNEITLEKERVKAEEKARKEIEAQNEKELKAVRSTAEKAYRMQQKADIEKGKLQSLNHKQKLELSLEQQARDNGDEAMAEKHKINALSFGTEIEQIKNNISVYEKEAGRYMQFVNMGIDKQLENEFSGIDAIDRTKIDNQLEPVTGNTSKKEKSDSGKKEKEVSWEDL